MAAPFAACLVLVGIHAYMGLHVLARGVIFVDLALAQIAALGAALALLLGHELDDTQSYFLSLGFTFIGAALLALVRTRRVPQEAIIGIFYVVASAAAILLLDRAPHGSEHIKTLLVGSVLWVSWAKVGQTALLYAALGAFHWALRSRFLPLSFGTNPTDRPTYIGWWDFLFYATFGVIITSSVQIAGVLLVFSILIVPAVCAALLADSLRARLAIAWAIGFAVSAAGCGLSYDLDLPTGATVVCAFGAALMLVALARRPWRSADRHGG